VHISPHHDIGITHAALGTYVHRHALEIAGTVREIYHLRPWYTNDSSARRTDIGWPIFETAGEKPQRDWPLVPAAAYDRVTQRGSASDRQVR
jgi:hypothetical protein